MAENEDLFGYERTRKLLSAGSNEDFGADAEALLAQFSDEGSTVSASTPAAHEAEVDAQVDESPEVQDEDDDQVLPEVQDEDDDQVSSEDMDEVDALIASETEEPDEPAPAVPAEHGPEPKHANSEPKPRTSKTPSRQRERSRSRAQDRKDDPVPAVRLTTRVSMDVDKSKHARALPADVVNVLFERYRLLAGAEVNDKDLPSISTLFSAFVVAQLGIEAVDADEKTKEAIKIFKRIDPLRASLQSMHDDVTKVRKQLYRMLGQQDDLKLSSLSAEQGVSYLVAMSTAQIDISNTLPSTVKVEQEGVKQSRARLRMAAQNHLKRENYQASRTM